MDLKLIENVDPDIAGAIAMEFDRQKNTLELIASENIASPAVMAVQASVLTNKYARDIRKSVIMVGVNTLILLKILP